MQLMRINVVKTKAPGSSEGSRLDKRKAPNETKAATADLQGMRMLSLSELGRGELSIGKLIVILSLLALRVSLAAAQTQGKYEPSNGCYIGAFIINDYNIGGDISRFEQVTKKKHSMYLNYASYGSPFPAQWVEECASKGAIAQIGFEPNGGLNEVTDSSYLRKWAIAARKSGAVIFLRWASEMNGPWVAWYGNPQLYIEKFRLVHDIMAKYAPNVAMVWAPNVMLNDPLSTPQYINSYYPGDEYVDWVGVDFYSTYVHSDGTPDQADPREKLQVVYNTYSSRKPIMICEWGATLYTKRTSPPLSTVNFCRSQIDSLYENVQAQFPRLKAICWFDYNATGVLSNLNDFCLTDSASVLNTYSAVVGSPYFLTEPYMAVPSVAMNPVKVDSISGKSVWVGATVKCDTQIDSVVLAVDGSKIRTLYSPPYACSMEVDTLFNGRHFVTMSAYAANGFANYDGDSIVVYHGKFIPDEIVQVSDSSSFSKYGSWYSSTSQPDRYGSYYYYSYPGGGNSIATWKVPIFSDGTYDVFAWWSAAPNRATNAPYIIYHSAGIDTVRVNQQVNGGEWNLLGSYYFRAVDSAVVTLSNDANAIVIADALRISPAISTDVRTVAPPVASSYNLFQNYPNPFNPTTVIRFSVPRPGYVSLDVYDVMARKVRTLVSGMVSPGIHQAVFDGSDLSSGIYFCRLMASGNVIVRKIVLLR